MTAALPAALLTSVETLEVRSILTEAADILTIDMANFASVTSVVSNLSTNVVTVSNLAATDTVTVNGNGSVTNGDLNADYVAAATASTININGDTTAHTITVTGAAVATQTINSTGGTNVLTGFTSAATTKDVVITAATNLDLGTGISAIAPATGNSVTISGAATLVDLGSAAVDVDIDTINASGMTAGGIEAVLNTSTTVVVTGGAGNDTITTGAVLTTGSVNAGAGTDTLVVGTNVGHINTAALAAKYTNFEVLRVNGTVDASLVTGITAIELSGATNAITKMSAAQASAVTARADIGATTLALATATGKSDVVSLTMGTGLTTSSATNAGALTINGFETLNVTAAPGATSAVGANKVSTIASFTADSLTAIDLSGTAVTLTNAATTKAVNIDGTALTGNGATAPIGLTISGNLVAGSAVKGSATAGNTFNLGTVGSSYTGGAGKDAFNITAVTQLRDGAVYNKIDGGAGEDTLTLTAGAAAVTLIDDDFKEIKNVEKVVIGNTGENAVSFTTGGFYSTNFSAAGVDVAITSTNTTGGGVTFAGGSFAGVQKLTVTSNGQTTADTSVLTGDGNDTVVVSATALTSGDVTINTGAGNDSIELTVSASVAATSVISLNGGAGKDTIKINGLDAADAQYVTIVVAAGQSSIAAFDSVTGFSLGGTDESVALDFAGTPTISANIGNTGITGFTAGELTYSVTDGILSFTGTQASTQTLAQKIALVDSLITANTASVAFEHSGNTYVYNENSGGDSLVELIGITGVTEINLGATTLATEINIT